MMMKNKFAIYIIVFTHFTILTVYLVSMCEGWKAVPANQAMYALKSEDFGIARQHFMGDLNDLLLPRDQLSHVYKFGWCTSDATTRPYLRKTLNLTFANWESTQASFIYLLAKKHTINHQLQCIVMKSYVPLKYLFHKSRLPLYYCQGIVYVLMLNTINRYEIHEFYIQSLLNMPITFIYEFYHPTPL